MKISVKAAALLFLTGLAFLNSNRAGASEGQRAAQSLDGTWQTAVTTDTAETAPVSGWKATPFPAPQYVKLEGKSQFFWYRRDITIPAEWKGRRLFIDLRGARYAPHLYLDGRPIGQQQNGWSPLEAEITQFVPAGGRHILELRCQDRGAALAPGFALPAAQTDEAMRGKTLSPVGGYKEVIGPWQSAFLESRPQNRLTESDLAIVPSTRKKTLTITGKADGNLANLWAEARVLDSGKSVLRLAPAPMKAAGRDWTLAAAFPNARCWSPEDSHLYTLEVTLRRGKSGPVEDVQTTRFGFKEIWTQGPDFYLNGVKRHLLASATWPLWEYESYAKIYRKVAAIKAGGAMAFRLHIGPWQEEWLKAADEAGLLIVEEAAVYTDGGGMYAYNDERFWENYRQFAAGMIRRDRNHACVAMWSLGNEILFMGNQKYDSDLPKKQGGLARYARTLDPHHPLTFEADLDPDGAYDVIGLHYPHEAPTYYDYPNTTDWLGSRVTTDAAGGMLGKQSSAFLWDRKKPLYIGEYLWMPQGDYSNGTIFFGDNAYLDRAKYQSKAQEQAFYDQTIAYRRSGVSGVAPWTVYGFGGAVENPELYRMQKEYYRPVAAYLQNRGLRFFSGEKTELIFDVFNDSDKPRKLLLRIEQPAGTVLAAQTLTLSPGGYQRVALPYAAPDVSQDTDVTLDSALTADGAEVHRVSHALRIFPRVPLQTPHNTNLLVYDPKGIWPGSVSTLEGLDGGANSRTILLVAPNALSPAEPEQKGVTVIGGRRFDTARFLAFLMAGGRALVLEQETLAPLGLDLTLSDFRSTMTFPLRESHPLLEGLRPEDLKFWRGDNYAALKQIRRPAAHGAQAVIVSGGPDALDQAAVVEMRVGEGRLILMQSLAGTRRETDPAAQRLLQNALDTLATELPAPANKTLVLSEDKNFTAKLTALGLVFKPLGGGLTEGEAKYANNLLIDGSGAALRTSGAMDISNTLENGGTVYWHNPDAETLAALRDALGAGRITIETKESQTTITDRENPLLSGISREDVTYTSKPSGWDKKMTMEPHGAGLQFSSLPAGAEILVEPAAVVTWKVGNGRVVLDGTHWDNDGDNAFKGRRFANNLFANLGFPFTPPAGGQGFESLALKDFRLVGSSPYFEGTADQITLRSNGQVEISFYCAKAGVYAIRIEANSTPYQGVYALVSIAVNGKPAGAAEIASSLTKPFLAGTVTLEKGMNVLALSFTNDASGGGEDRNLFVRGIALQPR